MQKQNSSRAYSCLLFTLLLLFLLLQIVRSSTIEEQGLFGTTFSKQLRPSTSLNLLFSQATPECSLSLTITQGPVASEFTNDEISYTLLRLSPASYTSKMVDASVTLMGVYHLIIGGLYNDASMLFTFKCPNGIMNVNPNTMKLFLLTNNFTPVTSALSNPTEFSFERKYSSVVPSSRAYQYTIGFGGVVGNGRAVMGVPQYFNSPSSFVYSDLGRGESLELNFPSIKPTLQSYSLNLKGDPSSTYFPDYALLKVFVLYTENNPSFEQAKVTYKFNQQIQDVNGNNIEIQKHTMTCFCSDANSYFYASPSIDGNTLTCNMKYSFSKIRIIAKLAPANPVNPTPEQPIINPVIPVNPVNSITPQNTVHVDPVSLMVSGEEIVTGVINKKVYYKIRLYRGQSLVLKHICRRDTTGKS